MMLTAQSIVTITQEQVTTRLDDETIILGFKTGNYYGLDAVGSLIWATIQQPVSVEQIVQSVTSEYMISEEQAFADTVELLQQLHTAGLVDIQA